MIVSLVTGLILFGLTFLQHGGFKRSISFNGGILFSIVMPPGTGKADLEKIITSAGFQNPTVKLTNPRTNQYDLELGPDVRDIIDDRIKKEEAASGIPKNVSERKTVSGEIEKLLFANIPGLSDESFISRETIAASYGSDLWKMALTSLFWTLFLIGVYVSFRFDFPFALGASLALLHDVILTIGFIGAFQIEPSVPVIAAVLTIVGYSMNDTIVIFDRIRERLKEHVVANIRDTMDNAITQTLSRTMITSALTMISVVALLLGGAVSLRDFALVLLFGIFVGTYSSIFIASHFVQYYEEIRAFIKKR